MPGKPKSRRDEPISLYREGADPGETLRALLEVKPPEEPSDEGAQITMAMPPPTGNREFRDDVIRIAELTVTSFILEGLTFQNCRIVGPAVLIPQGGVQIAHCSWDAPGVDAIFWEIPPERTQIVGGVVVKDCTFSKCTFQMVGIAGGAEMRSLLAN